MRKLVILLVILAGCGSPKQGGFSSTAKPPTGTEMKTGSIIPQYSKKIDDMWARWENFLESCRKSGACTQARGDELLAVLNAAQRAFNALKDNENSVSNRRACDAALLAADQKLKEYGF